MYDVLLIPPKNTLRLFWASAHLRKYNITAVLLAAMVAIPHSARPTLAWLATLVFPMIMPFWSLWWTGADFDTTRLLPSELTWTCFFGFWLLQWIMSLCKFSGLAAWSFTALAAAIASSFHPHLRLDALWPQWLIVQSAVGIGICVALYFTSSRKGNGIMDFYSGIDLHPSLCGVSIKLFCASRVGMMSWGVMAVVSLCNWSRAGLDTVPFAAFTSFVLQVAYVQRFFSWEQHYVNTMDQQHDRAGFMIIWGCLAFVPAVYGLAAVQTVPAIFNESTSLSTPASLLCLVIGFIALACLSESDDQKVRVRRDPENAKVFGRRATYITTERGTLLLTCGAWGTTRHMHYLFELACAISWTAPVAGSNWKGYAYVFFLFALLIQRTYRDDERCAKKYGGDWIKYCELVPYKIFPGVF